jgi:low temperature requirement protein LtrA
LDRRVTVPSQEAERVSTLELFFDLVFVFTITQLTGLLLLDLTVHGLASVLLILVLLLMVLLTVEKATTKAPAWS